MDLNRSILESPIPPDTQAEIANRFWGSGTFQLPRLQPYFQYYTEQCLIVFQCHKSSLPLKTHQDIVEIADDILHDLERAEVKEKLVQRYAPLDANSDCALDACIDLTVRLVFMLDAGEFPNAFSGRSRLVWSRGTIRDFMLQTFPDRCALPHNGLRFGRAFNVLNMIKIAGLKVELTTNLADHLRLRDTNRTVTIFHHASFLKIQRESPVFPKGLVDETLATISLILPERDRACRKWYNRQEPSDELDHTVFKCGSAQRRFDEYKFWHDRLVILKEEFDESRPSTLSQWWNDRREGTQWYALWVAVFFAVLFGLAQSIIGALQLYKAYHL